MADLDELVGQSPAIAAVRNDLRRLLTIARDRSRLPAILIQGETGTGKGLVARLLHRHGPRASGPLVDVNCAAIPAALLEGELFGYERGAFTDARRAKPGLFQMSSGGVLFLDEVGLLPESLQAKLLTAIEEKAVRRLGGTAKERFDSWIVSATNAELDVAVRERRFREDLYHRLAVLTLYLPPLRERAGDAVLLAERFLERACAEYGVAAKALSADARALIARSPWPGNVRELANVMERLALLVDSTEVSQADLEAAQHGGRSAAPAPSAGGSTERAELLAALEATGWNIMRTAARLGLARNTVRARMDRHGLRARRGPAGEPSRAESPSAAESPPVVAPAAPSDIRTVRWERRHVTLLRVTLVGAADRSIDAGRLLNQAAEKVTGFGGRTEALGRVSLDASFGVAPIENAARRAVSAALAIQKAVTDASRPDLAATTVVHTGQATVGRTGETIVIDEGDRPALATVLDAIGAHARSGAVHLSASTAPFVERDFELRPDPQVDATATASFTVLRRDSSGIGVASRLTRFVGRAAELQLLQTRWDLARQGRGQVVGVVGEAGAGKSRLLLELTGRLDRQSVRVLRVTTAASEDPSRSRPAASLLTLLFDLEPADPMPDVHEALTTRLGALGLEPALSAPLAALLELDVHDPDWLGLEASQRARRMLDALRRVIVRESFARPMLIVLEDLHWIDADTQVALDSLVEFIPSARILLLLTYRPEYRHRWSGKTFYTQLRVDALPAEAAGELLDHLLGPAAELASLKRELAQWTEGNPFFLEECVRTLAETGALAGRPGGPPPESVAHLLPATVEDTLAARMNRLPSDARHVVQCAAAIGTDFSDAVLSEVADIAPEALEAHLRVLEEAEFVYPAAEVVEGAHVFKHALTHLVAYRSLPPERQRGLHAQILAALELRPTGSPDARVEALAEHAVRGEVWSKAVLYLRQAGGRALTRSAHRAAADYFERAMETLERTTDPTTFADTAVDIRLDLRHALTPLGEVERILSRLREAELIAGRIGDARRLGRVLTFQANGLFTLGDHARAIECGSRALSIARDLDDEPMAIAAEQYAGRALHAQGNYRAALEIFRRLAASLTGERASANLGLPVPPAIFARAHLVWCLAELGEFAEALRVGDEAVRLAEAVAQPEALQWACYPLGLLALDRDDVVAALPLLERVLTICQTTELPVYLPRTMAALGHARVLRGDAEALGTLEQAVAEAEGRRQVNVYPSALGRLVEAYLTLGHIDRALPAAERAVDLARKRGERGTEARVLRLQGIVYQRVTAPRLDEAEAALRGAVAISDELDMRPQLARARLALGALLRVRGRTDEARDALTAARAAAERLGLSQPAAEAARELAALA
jgi:transcriptional regulator with AAA-type ATPase domain/tetratricopeptide (TPR) repeat protein